MRKCINTIEGSLSLVWEREEVLPIESARALGEARIQFVDCDRLVLAWRSDPRLTYGGS
jgi:hypothetical protein